MDVSCGCNLLAMEIEPANGFSNQQKKGISIEETSS
jgi:hypothetical protein